MSRCAVQTFVFALLGMTLLLGCATQQDVVTLDDRLAAIEQRNAETEQRSLQFESRLDEYMQSQEHKRRDLKERSAGQNVQIDGLREDTRALSGKLEETQYVFKRKVKSLDAANDKRKHQVDRIEQMMRSNTDRILRLEQYLNLETTESEPNFKKESNTKADLQSQKELSADEIYTLAKQAFDKNDFEASREGFQQLLKQYPKSGRADNAQFWIGETYYREKWYEKAILEYQKVIEAYPKGNKVPASLLKQGFAFSSLGDKANARLILTELVKKYPKSPEAKIAKQKLKGFKP